MNKDIKCYFCGAPFKLLEESYSVIKAVKPPKARNRYIAIGKSCETCYYLHNVVIDDWK